MHNSIQWTDVNRQLSEETLMSSGLTSGSCRFKKLMGQVSAALGTEVACSVPPFLLPFLSPSQMV